MLAFLLTARMAGRRNKRRDRWTLARGRNEVEFGSGMLFHAHYLFDQVTGSLDAMLYILIGRTFDVNAQRCRV